MTQRTAKGEPAARRNARRPGIPQRAASADSARRPLGEEHAEMSAGFAREERILAERGRAGDVDAEQQLITANLALASPRRCGDYRQCGVPSTT